MSDLSMPTEDVMRKIQKLLNLASKNTSEAEAGAAAAKAQALLTEYNLTAEMISNARPEDGKREQAKVRGGFYAWQRDLWFKVAQLNFCLHWVQEYDDGKTYKTKDGYPIYGKGGRRNRHVIVGRVVNSRATQAMASYLQGRIMAIGDEVASQKRLHPLSNFMHSYRQGATQRVLEKIAEERARFLKEEERERVRKAKLSRDGVSTTTAVALSNYISAETDANNDFLHGEGWSARQAAQRAEWAEERRREREAYTKWAAAHPEEARAKQEEAEKEARRYRGGRSRWSSGPRDKTDYTAYHMGYDKAETISLNRQTEGGAKNAPRLK